MRCRFKAKCGVYAGSFVLWSISYGPNSQPVYGQIFDFVLNLVVVFFNEKTLP